jgi:hypothetical protein
MWYIMIIPNAIIRHYCCSSAWFQLLDLLLLLYGEKHCKRQSSVFSWGLFSGVLISRLKKTISRKLQAKEIFLTEKVPSWSTSLKSLNITSWTLVFTLGYLLIYVLFGDHYKITLAKSQINIIFQARTTHAFSLP